MKIFLDCDGVLFNLAQSIADWFEIENYTPKMINRWDSFLEITNLPEKQFYSSIATPDFWENLEFYPEAENLISELLHITSNITLLTTPARGCAGYRQNLIRKKLPHFYRKGKYLIGPDKAACANQDTILIDDYFINTERFQRKGGYSILYPQYWNKWWNIDDPQTKIQWTLSKIEIFNKIMKK